MGSEFATTKANDAMAKLRRNLREISDMFDRRISLVLICRLIRLTNLTVTLLLVLARIGSAQDVLAGSDVIVKERPPNFYHLIETNDQAICSSVLRSLNKRYAMTRERWSFELNPNLYGELVLSSDLQLPWRLWRRFEIEHTTEAFDYVRVDLANNGQPVTVFRWAFSDRWQRNQLFLISELPEAAPGNPVSEQFWRKVSGPNDENDLVLDKDTAPDLWNLRDYPGRDNFDFNIIKAEGKTLLLAANAAKAQAAVDKGGTFGAFVLEYQSQNDISLVCHLKGGQKKIQRG